LCTFALLGFSEVSSVFSPKKWLPGLQKDSHLAEALGSSPAIHCFLTGRHRKKKSMKKIAIEVRSGTTRFKVALLAESSEGALEIVKRYNPGKECKVVFPIDPESFFAR
jgi:hypothetical protein